jgi:ABC-type transporter Mla subunit MlaD
MRRVLALGALAAVLVALVAIVAGGSSPYVIRVRLADAAGLRQNSPVMIGGVQAGTVTLHLGRGDQVIASLKLDRAQAPVGRNASVAIAAVNFLGQKEAELSRGNLAHPAPTGYVIPASRVTVSTDLDQVLGVLDASTRTRLAILIDEAGTALTGRRQDLSTILAQLPPTLQSADALLSGLVSDNHTLAHLVDTSDQFISETNARRTQLAGLVDRAGQAAVSVEARRSQLAQTLARAPGTLAELHSFLDRLQATAAPLGPAATDLAATAPAASAALAQVGPFVGAATPALHEATTVAPRLTELATRATPVLAQANPTVASLATFSGALAPVSTILDGSVDNILAVVDNWSRAIQFRDGLSHVFRGEASITPDVLRSLVSRLLGKLSLAAPRHRSATANPVAPPKPAPAPAAPAPKPTRPGVNVGGVLAGVGATVHKVLSSTPPPPSSSGQPLSSLLHYLLGK